MTVLPLFIFAYLMEVLISRIYLNTYSICLDPVPFVKKKKKKKKKRKKKKPKKEKKNASITLMSSSFWDLSWLNVGLCSLLGVFLLYLRISPRKVTFMKVLSFMLCYPYQHREESWTSSFYLLILFASSFFKVLLQYS